MKIKIHTIPEEGLYLEGDEPPSILDLSEPLFHFKNPIHYQLEICWTGIRSLLIRGRLSAMIRVRCVRTLEWFDLPIVIENFQSHRSELEEDEVDLTQEIREDILLALPSNPISPLAESLKPLKKTEQPTKSEGNGNVWGILNQLKLK